MPAFEFEVVNVFAQSTFGGNPLAVFPDARGLDDAAMAAITDQLNLSETTFVFPPARGGAARVRIFSPGYEMDFAGHPTLGTAYVVRARQALGDAFALELNVGPIDVRGQGDQWELKSAPASSRPVATSREALASALGLRVDALVGTPRWVSCGSEQLLIPLRSVADVHAVQPAPVELFSVARSAKGRVSAYVFARDERGVTSRFFWEQHGAVREDPGTGSACANLGGFLNAEGEAVPSLVRVEQGHATGRLNVLTLRRDAQRDVFVGGRVVPLMRGTLSLPTPSHPT
jgi:PhzF family phenazine biosynthesis protein